MAGSLVSASVSGLRLANAIDGAQDQCTISAIWEPLCHLFSRPQEVLASATVRDLVAGSGMRFDDRGNHVLKGVPGDWRLFAVTST